MKKIYLAILGVLVLATIPAVVFAAAAMKAESHATPPTTIEADFKFVDTGSILKIKGKAKGMDSDHPYSTLIYDTGSAVKGVNACEPTDGTLFGPNRMVVGDWVVAADGTGTLGPVVLGPGALYVALSEIGTISVRAGVALGPGTQPVVLCGEVK